MPVLSRAQLNTVLSILAQRLDTLGIDYAIMGGAAVCLIANDPTRMTEDVDLVVHVDHRRITADLLTSLLIRSYPDDFAPITQYGHTIPGYKLKLLGGASRLVELEVFDYQSWPQRPQYDIPAATRTTVAVSGQQVKTFSAEWIFREKVLSQYQRQGSRKEETDIRDLFSMVPFLSPGKVELDFNHDQSLKDALRYLLQKRPDLEDEIEGVVKCTAVLGS
ncbi:hypothetical protein BO70DRAFT_177611 [Aspergillus heteromorphus CBS 117.55]|uniref:Nucleotidyl transferase AbiEii/AbiGii toxin family protein n=1 Tax=Aspergillus heteromorphus CBS 117.55 TaxID=1448321 RepID=A0A317WSA8_9EURO|nr:uncharacterized protein BO70DRAFT_177611 [Aspergillus heteromorphus CBS 117.55]PWY88212.1 hypothetical protein BO70DRAFT_177611 [Aspergillus heteromorphus CBS 117.55]